MTIAKLIQEHLLKTQRRKNCSTKITIDWSNILIKTVLFYFNNYKHQVQLKSFNIAEKCFQIIKSGRAISLKVSLCITIYFMKRF